MDNFTPCCPGYWKLGLLIVKVIYHEERLVYTVCGCSDFFEINNVPKGLKWRGYVFL